MNEITTLEFSYSHSGTVVEYIYPELTAVCPTTGLPDYYTLRIVFQPDKKIPELKSLKLYFVSYRNVGIWHEHLANKILEDFVRVVEPKWVFVELFVNNRGGILTTVRRFWSKSDGDKIEKVFELWKDRREIDV